MEPLHYSRIKIILFNLLNIGPTRKSRSCVSEIKLISSVWTNKLEKNAQ